MFSLSFVVVVSVLSSTYVFANQNLSVPMHLETLLHLMKITFKVCDGIEWCTIFNNETIKVSSRGCCPVCSCHEGCELTKSCCPDVRLSRYLGGTVFSHIYDLEIRLLQESGVPEPEKLYNDEMPPYAECVLARLRNVTYLSAEGTSYVMVSKCPTINSDKTNATVRCESPAQFDENSVLQDFIPVQSMDTGVVYRNRFCAASHGVNVDTLQEWDVFVKSQRIPTAGFTLQVVSFQDLVMSEIVDIMFKPSKEFETSATVCNRIDITSCGNDENTYSSLQDSTCQIHEYPINTWWDDNFIVFKNLACTQCTWPATVYPRKCMQFYQWETGIAFTANLDTRSNWVRKLSNKQEVINRALSAHCDSGFVFDKQADLCRRLYCPCGMVVANHECVPVYQSIYNKMYTVTILIIQIETISNELIPIFEIELVRYIRQSIQSSNSFLVENLALFKPKPNYVHHNNKHCVHVAFSAQSQFPLFLNALQIIKDNFMGIKIVQGASLTVQMYMSVSDSFDVRSTVAVDKSTTIEYEMVRNLSNPLIGLKIEVIVPLHECNFCYMVEILDSEINKERSRSDLIMLKRTNMKIFRGIYTALYNASQKLACVQFIVPPVPTDIAADDDDDLDPLGGDTSDVPVGPVSGGGPLPSDDGDGKVISMTVTLAVIVTMVCGISIVRKFRRVRRQTESANSQGQHQHQMENMQQA